MKRTLLSCISLFLCLFTIAEGSKDLYPSGCIGKRAFLQSRDITDPRTFDMFPTRGTMKVYVEAGETLYLGSSAQGIGAGTINVRTPNGSLYRSKTNTEIGCIKTRTQELAGPQVDSYRTDGYTPFTIDVNETGIWEVDFIAPGTGTTATDADANGNWTQPNASSSSAGIIAAFDISVSKDNGATLEGGRMFCNTLNGNMIQKNPGDALYITYYVMTNVGYVYKVQSNGQNGASFNIFVNNKGIQDGSTGESNSSATTPPTWKNGDPAYKSVNYSNVSNQTYIYDPRLPDNAKEDITHKIFFEYPSTNLPETANISYNGASKTSTWLRKEVTLPEISNIKIEGAEGGTEGVISPDGANISFSSNVDGKVSIKLTFSNGSSRTLTGKCEQGDNNIIAWNGKDGDGNTVSKVSFAVEGTISAGEVHFPMGDVEINPNGIIIEVLDGYGNVYSPTKDTVYWNDEGLSNGTPPNPKENISGLSSHSNGHKWGQYTYWATSEYGDKKIIDTWSYVECSTTSSTVTAETQTIDLAVNSIVPNVKIAKVGDNVTYTITVENINNTAEDAIIDAVGAKFGFEAPEGFMITNHTFSSTAGSENSVSATGGNTFTSKIDLTNGGKITYTISGTITAKLAHKTLTPRAYIIRPPDVIDIDATSDSTGIPNNPDVECSNSCNNIKTASYGVIILNSAPVATNDSQTKEEDSTATGNVLINDTDIDLDTLKVTNFTVDTDGNNTQERFSVGDTAKITDIGAIVILDSGYYAYSPVSNFSGTVPTVTYTINDGYYGTNTGKLDITITAVNDAPIISATNESISENTTTVETVTATDVDIPAQKLSFSIFGGDDASMFLIDETTGKLTFKSAPDFESPDDTNTDNIYLVKVMVTDDGLGNLSDSTDIAVTILNGNELPTANNDSVSTHLIEDGANGTINILSNDTDEEGNPTAPTNGNGQFSVDIDPSKPNIQTTFLNSTGSWVYNTNTSFITYDPADNYNGTASITYELCDTGKLCNQANIVFTVDAVNDAPTASDESITFDEDTKYTFSSSDFSSYNDIENDAFAGIKIMTLPSVGKLIYNNSDVTTTDFEVSNITKLIFSPSEDENGSPYATFDFKVFDNSDYSDLTYTMTININAINDAPIISAKDTTIAENITTVENLTATDKDTGDKLSFSISSTDANLFDIDATSGELTFKTAPDYENPTDDNKDNIYNITVTVTDTASHSDSQSIAITIDDVNDNTPVITATDKTIDENTTAVETISATDNDQGDKLTFTISGTDASLFNIDATSGELTFKTAPDFEKPTDDNKDNSYNITVKVTDNASHSDSQNIAITVADINDNTPVITATNKTIDENTTAVETVSATDSDQGDKLTFTISGTDASLFNIDATSGELTFKTAPDYENPTDDNKDNIYNITVTVTDTASHSDSQSIAITIDDVNDNTPVITATDKTIDENTTAVETISATDNDQGDKLTFTISGTDASLFNIDATSGELTFKTAPDFEKPTDDNKDNSYNITVKVTDNASHSDSQNIAITVADINDNTPVITATNKTIDENTTAVETVSATDSDQGDKLTFTISGTDASLFNIDATSGELTFKAAPDYENPTDDNKDNIYNITVTITDAANQSDNQSIAITVSDVNDNTPVITATDKTIDENTTAVETVSATDSDQGDKLTFSISGGTDASLFNIDATSGELTFNTAPDFEIPTDDNKDNTYNITVTVTDTASHSDSQSIAITVADINDNTPVISASDKTIDENTTAVETVSATDCDQGDKRTFSISGGTDASLFNIDATSGELTFKTAPDYEIPTDNNKDNIYNITVTVTDTASHSDSKSIKVTVSDVNDNAPVITATDKTIDENTTAVETVLATDRDQGDKLTFTISGNDASLFNIDATSGELTFKTAPDYESPTDDNNDNIYNITVMVTDNASHTDSKSIKVTVVDVNDNTPVITATDKTIDENTTAVETVLATDSDQGDKLTFSISGGTDANLFDINATSGELTFKTAPDYENPTDDNKDNIYNITVTVTDTASHSDSKSIKVTVSDVNDNTPVITATDKTIDENTTAVETVLATDRDQGDKLTFTISGNDASLFNIDATSGELTFKTAPDYESPTDDNNDNIYNITVMVTDNASHTDSKSIKVTVVDVNDNTPVITATDKTIDENTTAVETVLATDSDQGDKRTFSISGGTDANLFDINATSGELTFKTAPDYENPTDDNKDNIYNITVTVTDTASHSDSKSIKVTVSDVNDNAPVITATDKTIDENTTAVETVSATDDDQGDKLTFSISGGNDASLFNIDATSGELTFKTAPDYEIPTDNNKDNTYNITVTVTDNASHSDDQSIAITVSDVNDNAPVITATDKTIDENTTAVETVSATDCDQGDKLTFTISGNDAGLFNIDATSGVLTFKTAPDYEIPTDDNKDNSYNITVTVTDTASHSDSKSIKVTVSDVNDNAPVITATDKTIDENTTEVETVSATDSDQGDKRTFSISGGTDASLFNIDATSGVLTFKIAPDYENPTDNNKDNIYSITVTVTDAASHSDSKSIKVTVVDVNDNAPVITATDKTIDENTTEVETVSATDSDQGDKLTFTISGNDASLFNIDATSGELTFKTAPDFEKPTDNNKDNSYNITVTVTDAANQSDSQSIAITVDDVNDNTPVISASDKTIDENTTAVETVSATDNDQGDKLTFSISGGTDASLFNIDASSGEVTFKTAPDFEKPTDNNKDNSYNITVTVTDAANQSDSQSIAITVSDVNDNTPVISASDKTIDENTTAVETVSATDRDQGDKLTFTISGNDAGLFNIDATSGELTFKTAPDFENPTDDNKDNIYNINVTVTDAANHSDNQSIAITVSNVNDNTPVITATDKTIDENTTAVETVSTTDADQGDKLTFTISGNDASLFNIDATSGELTFKTAPDFENPTDDNKDNIYNITVTVTDAASHNDSQSIAITVADVNDNTPVISASDKTIDENTTAVETVLATDSDQGDKLTFSISGGTDASLFNIDATSGVLTFKTAPNYENPTDNNKDNIYNITVTVTDAASHSDSKSIAITIDDVNDNTPVIIATDKTIDENTTEVETVSATDSDQGDKRTFSISGGTDASLFNIDATSGVLTFKIAPDYENPTDNNKDNIYSITVTVTDAASHSDSKSIKVTVVDVNDNTPVITATDKTIDENTTAVETVSATDGDKGDKLSFTISGTDASLFNIDASSGEVTFKTAPDFENPTDNNKDNTYNITVMVTDNANHSDSKNIKVTVSDVNDNAPVIIATDKTIDENTTAVETVSATDSDQGDKLTFNISGGTDASLFNIDATSGVLTFKTAPNYENPTDNNKDNIYNITVTVTDAASHSDSKSITITVADINDNTPIISASDKTIDENTTAVETVSATDSDQGDKLTFTISGNDASLFNINATSGELTFKTAPDFEKPTDNNKDNSYNITVTVTDAANQSDSQSIAITVDDVNDNTPVISASDKTIDENTTAVETVSATDNDQGDKLTFSISGGTDASLFNIDASSGEVTFKTAPDYENPTDDNNDNIYNITVMVTDAANQSDNQSIAITVSDVNDNTPIISASDKTIDENTTAVETVSATDSDQGDKLTFTISGSDASLFNIDATSGELTFKTAPDYESPTDDNKDNTYNITVTVTDAASHIDSQNITITVADINDNTPIISASDKTIDENTTAVETVSATDSDQGDKLTFTISGNDASLFNINATSGELTFKTAPDFEKPTDNNNDNIYNITVTVTDAASHSDNQSIAITVANINDEAPIAANDSIIVNSGGTTTTLANGATSVTDNDTDAEGNTLTVSLVSDASHGTLTLNSDGTFSYTHDGTANYTDSFTYKVNDGEDDSNTATVSIKINTVNSAPVAANDNIIVNAGGTTTVLANGNTSVTDNDTDAEGNNLTVSLVSDASHGTLILNSDGTFSYTHDGTANYSDSFTYKVNDGEDDSNTATVNIKINTVNSAPVAINDNIIVNAGGTTTVLANGNTSVTDNDTDAEGNNLTVSLVSDASHGTLTLNSDGTFSYTHDGTANYTDSFTYKVYDGEDDSNTATVNIKINTVNSAPVAVNDNIIVNAGGTTTVLANGNTSVTDNDTDAEGNNLTVSLVSDASHGTLTLNSDGTFSYTHDGTANYTDSFTYKVNDGEDDSNTATVSIKINTVNSAPVAANDNIIVNAGGTTTVLANGNTSVTDNDTDAEGNNLTVSLVSDASHGTLILNSDGTFSYTHDGTANYSDSFTYKVNDGEDDSNTATVNIKINTVNSAPVAINDNIIVNAGGTTTVLANGNTSVTDNDTDAEGNNLTVSLVSDASHGTLTLNSDGTFSYTHDGTANYTASFTYKVYDGEDDSNTATVNIKINTVNSAPVAVNDNIIVNAGGTTTVLANGNTSVTDNDTDAEGNNLTVSLVSDASHGTLTLNSDGTFSYTHDGTANYTDSFTYKVNDGEDDSNTATVSIKINTVNSAPVAANDNIIVNAGGTTTVLANGNTSVTDNDTDAEGNNLTVSLVSDASHGTLILNSDGTFSYTHDGTANYSDSFTYKVNDGEDDSNTATVNIKINTVNSAPVAINDNIIVNAGGTTTVLANGNTSVTDNDTDAEGNNLTVSLVSDASHGTLTLNSDGTFSYTHDGTANYTDSFTYKVYDGEDDSNTATVNIKINTVNSAPVAVNDNIIVNAGGTTTVLANGNTSVTDNDTDAEGNNLTVSLVSDASHGTLTLNSDGTFSYTHDGTANYSDSFTYKVYDGEEDSNTATVNIKINTVNSAPVAINDNIIVNAGGTTTVLANGSTSVTDNDTDAEGNKLTVSLVSDASHGTLTLNSDGTFFYTHDGTDNYTDSFTYKVNDGEDDSNTATVRIKINTVNSAPVAINDNIIVNAGGTTTVLANGNTSVTDNDTDAEGNNLTVSLVSDASHGTLTLNSDGTFSYTHDGTTNYSDSFTYKVNDGEDDSNTATVSIKINTVNSAPVAVNDNIIVNEGGTTTALANGATSVTDNDTDAEGNTLTVSLVSDVSYGTLILNSDGTFSYTHDGTANYTDSFTYKVNDGEDDSNTATVNIKINTVNSAPVAVNDNIIVNAGGTTTVLANGNTSVTDNDTDAEGNKLTVSLVSDASHGTLILNSDGTFSYTHDGTANYTDSFTYKVNDGEKNSNVATVYITVNAVNTAPVAINDSIVVECGNTVSELINSSISILDNDTDAEGNTLTASLISDVSYGTLTLNSDGTFSYTHDGSANYSDSFTYKAYDGSDESNIASVYITINATNTPPVAINDSIVVEYGKTITELSNGATSVLDNDTDIEDDYLTVDLVKDVSYGTLALYSDGTFSYEHNGTENYRDSFTYKVKDDYAEGNIATVFITINELDYFINPPQIFTPNNNGQNDYFVIKNLENYTRRELIIVNCSGNKVYESDNYNNDWDGTSNTGLTINKGKLPTGTYFYVLRYGDKRKTGYVYLQR